MNKGSNRATRVDDSFLRIVYLGLLHILSMRQGGCNFLLLQVPYLLFLIDFGLDRYLLPKALNAIGNGRLT